MLESLSAATDLDLISYLKAIPDSRVLHWMITSPEATFKAANSVAYVGPPEKARSIAAQLVSAIETR